MKEVAYWCLVAIAVSFSLMALHYWHFTMAANERFAIDRTFALAVMAALLAIALKPKE